MPTGKRWELQRAAIRAARLRAEGKTVYRPEPDEGSPDDLILVPEVARMAGLADQTIRWMRKYPGPHPLPPSYMKVKNPKTWKGFNICWQRQSITDWVLERRAVQLAPVVLNWYEIHRLLRLLDSPMPEFGERIGKECREILSDALGLEKGDTDG